MSGKDGPLPPGCTDRVSPSALRQPLTLILWKFTLQLAPAREGMKRSPCLLGEDTGELAGVRVRRISATWKDGRVGWVPQSPKATVSFLTEAPPTMSPCPWPLAEDLILGVTHVLAPVSGTTSEAQFVSPTPWQEEAREREPKCGHCHELQSISQGHTQTEELSSQNTERPACGPATNIPTQSLPQPWHQAVGMSQERLFSYKGRFNCAP